MTTDIASSLGILRPVARVAALTLAAFFLVTQSALAAKGFDGGQGTYGETNDKVVTDAAFIVIAFFPLIILAFSMLQWRLDKRKERRKAADKARRARADVRGGW
jgi:preprotein translocase subunit SecG